MSNVSNVEFPRSESFAPARRAGIAAVPRVDVFESRDDVILVADLPGVEEKDIDVTVEKNTLTIVARCEQTAPEGYQRVYGSDAPREYRRVFALADAVDKDRIHASMRNGTLRLTLPKASAAKPRKVAVQVAA